MRGNYQSKNQMASLVFETTTNRKIWCLSRFHKWFYGSNRILTEKLGDFEIVEYFCNKCGLKTEGYTHFKIM